MSAIMIQRWLKRIAFTLLGLVLLMGLYLAMACALMFWPAHAKPSTAASDVEAWVLSNGVHTDLVFPIHSTSIDWQQLFPPTDFKAVPPDAEFIAIGWGDREFYLNTPTWADLTASRAVGALLGGNRALIHVTYLQRGELRNGAYKLPLSQAQYVQLVDYVRAALPSGQATPISGAHYGHNDAFYEAEGGYNFVETCNTWTGRGLRHAGVTVSRWTPFDFNVVWHLQPATP
ncbi:TIGR02117 family protein [Polaromonas sp. SM01]|uniref:TIGR02117 family protein n=1 Tax=Polaromonas sp. SM01 TaxID=3085630 RepID=UPI002982A25E|nr:TIGR02117 family protein [Polaromonas sp. SM01]MDW5443611.1 TIGR02117 family protein [Polaromonas sp. SM01]